MRGRELVAVILATGLMLSVLALTAAAVVGAVSNEPPGLSERAAQILNTAYGGIIGLLGSFAGAQLAISAIKRRTTERDVDTGEPVIDDDEPDGL